LSTDRPNNLASCLVHNGTVTHPRDMVRALETLETLTYRQTVDGELMAEGNATLVKIMAESGASTILVNECLFVNVLSFRYLTFTTDAEGGCVFDLVGDGMTLSLIPVEVPEGSEERLPTLLLDVDEFDEESFVMLDDDEDEDGR
jgi:hypothetical protein